jgi:DNA-binding response OmpR family regulator
LSTRILIVEDDSIIGIDLVMRCKMFGFEDVKLVFTGEEAIEEIELYDPHIYILDIVLSGNLSGIDVAKNITEVNSSAVIFLTGNPQLVEKSDVLDKFGFYRIISKPVSKPQLKQVVEEADLYLNNNGLI